ncbi:uncharacterized protein LOC34617518 [Cyclospora cayetanensis]|nr:uncharacterized protein LOC34617518 [Cyclospora cayetanensis]
MQHTIGGRTDELHYSHGAERGLEGKTSRAAVPRNQELTQEAFMSSCLPRASLASNLLLPDCAQLNRARGSASLSENDQAFLDEAAGKQLSLGLPPGEVPAKPGVRQLPANSEQNMAIADNGHTPTDRIAAATAAGRLLERARLLQSTASGLYCVLPLGFRVMKKIEAICHQELARIGAAPLCLPNLMPMDWLQNSDRVRSFGESLYRLHDRRKRQLFLPPTCEEAAAWLASTGVRSHRELPLLFYQIGPKFRDEFRPRAGCLRSREFVMLEAYSFHQDVACRDTQYREMDECFRRIFARLGATPVYRVPADPGTMGGPCSHEYHVSSELGSDNAASGLIAQDGSGSRHNTATQAVAIERLPPGRSLEVAHCFQLPGVYCEAAKARFTDSQGVVRVPLMNSYGLGVSRLLAHLALTHQDAKGVSFPPQVAPFCVAILPQPAARWNSSNRSTRVAVALFRRLQKIAADVGGFADVLLDDRRGLSLHQMQAHADLVGIPRQVVIKEKLLWPPGRARVLCISRRTGTAEIKPLRSALAALKDAFLEFGTSSKQSL